ncbi:hypothetical protein O4G98_20695 [Zoogloeaceae bacterium G21618-S1]|uniref:Uncharacterized protein n=1 Tax=Denitromonas halophila TaxID=1629404 RepID=A0A557QKM9_9RHOO|nr:hypothetical protein [Denitromonas halophila]MCZ4307156.1 hypothetical protein [Zoogloeaceae bacterium G21618-S1]TVO53461.1 hypothetical protein FHP91_16965 [Denitromonas halophila]
MKLRTLLIGSLSALAGAVVGFLGAVKLFAIDVDLLSVPYANEPVTTTEPFTASDGAHSLVVPAGASLIHRYSPKGVPVYSLEFVGTLSSSPRTVPASDTGYFYVQ